MCESLPFIQFKLIFRGLLGFYEAFYIGTEVEKIVTNNCFFKEVLISVTTCGFMSSSKTSAQIVAQLCGGRKTMTIYAPYLSKRYLTKKNLWVRPRWPYSRGAKDANFHWYHQANLYQFGVILNICGGHKAILWHMLVFTKCYHASILN